MSIFGYQKGGVSLPRPAGRRVSRRGYGTLVAVGAMALAIGCSDATNVEPSRSPLADEPSLRARALDVRYEASTDAVVFEMRMEGDAGLVRPTPAGQVHGAPVLGYVFLTSLAPDEVGFDAVEGTVALAVTSHPDFDDTPLWDEDGNADFDDDGVVYHAHWVVLVEDARAPAGLAVRQADAASKLPPTAPMDMYLDSPGFTVVEDGDTIRVLVPSDRIKRSFDMEVGGVTAYMEVDASGDAPLLAVHELLSSVDDGAVATTISGRGEAGSTSWPARTVETPLELTPEFDVEEANARYSAADDAYVLSMKVAGSAGTIEPAAAGQVDGAPILGYVFPTTIPPQAIGFLDISGTVALAVTSHPDFDDTPLWDETMDGRFDNDGGAYHVHWVVLVEDSASDAGLSVPSQTDTSRLPPTAPMSMYLDAPGYHAFADEGSLSVVVPAWHLRGVDTFSYDALTARMVVDAGGTAPVVRVEQVYSVLSGDLSLPLTVSRTLGGNP